jgi:protein TonB
MQGSVLFAPTKFPPKPFIEDQQEAPLDLNAAITNLDDGKPGDSNPFGSQNRRPLVHQQITGPVRVSGMVVEGLLIHKMMPEYPAIARATGTQGTVVLQATISRAGTIENLRVISGPIMLQQAALNAVQLWRYRPYLLNGDPVEVETTVNVIFKMQQ